MSQTIPATADPDARVLRAGGDADVVRRDINISQDERQLSVVMGIGLTALGLYKRGGLGLGMAAAGAGMVFRGVTGHCYGYQLLGTSTAEPHAADPTNLYEHGIRLESSVTVSRPAEELYDYWSDLTNLPTFMPHVKRIEVREGGQSTWYIHGPGNVPFQYEAKTINEDRPTVIAWQSVGGSDIHHAGAVRFTPVAHGTEVRAEIQALPPGGRWLGAAAERVMSMLGQSPQNDLDQSLRNFKQLMEAGEVATVEGQPSGRASE
jgi:uncharacterized membrane protein